MRLRQSSAADSKLRPDGGEGRRKEGEKEVERKGGREGGLRKGNAVVGGRTREIRSATPNFIHRSYSGLTGLILLLACSALSKRQKP